MLAIHAKMIALSRSSAVTSDNGLPAPAKPGAELHAGGLRTQVRQLATLNRCIQRNESDGVCVRYRTAHPSPWVQDETCIPEP